MIVKELNVDETRILRRFAFSRKQRIAPANSQFKEKDFNKKPEIQIAMPDTLKSQLVDDWENITKNTQVSYDMRNRMINNHSFFQFLVNLMFDRLWRNIGQP